jgi:hypothetical protein
MVRGRRKERKEKEERSVGKKYGRAERKDEFVCIRTKEFFFNPSWLYFPTGDTGEEGEGCVSASRWRGGHNLEGNAKRNGTGREKDQFGVVNLVPRKTDLGNYEVGLLSAEGCCRIRRQAAQGGSEGGR